MASVGNLPAAAPVGWARPGARGHSPLKTSKIAYAINQGSFCGTADVFGAHYFPGGDIHIIHFFPGASPLMLSGHVTVPYYEDENAPTGTCAVSVLGGERFLIANLSAANCYKSDHLKQPENWALVEKAKYFYIAGFFSIVSPNSIHLVPEHAAANDKMFKKNLSAPFICEFRKDAEEEVLLYVDSVSGNEAQAQTSSAGDGWEDPDPVVAVEDGKVNKFPVIKLPTERLVDTKGAGDAFVGGFVSQLVQ